MADIQPARGFRDLLPKQKIHRENLLSRIRDIYRRYGFQEIETPVTEPLDRLRNSEGGENTGMIFEILRRGLTEADLRNASDPSSLCDLGLRYDLTVPLARYFATNASALPAVFKSIQVGPVWRAERPQKGRYRQFTQCDIDIMGDASVRAEIELIVATLAALGDLGLTTSVVRLNDRRFLDAILAASGVPEDQRPRTLVVVDKLDKIGISGVESGLADFLSLEAVRKLVGILTTVGQRELTTQELLSFANGNISVDALRDHTEIVAVVRELRGTSSIRFDPSLVRGLGYYTGPIFEVEHPGSKSSIAGGGRYDAMIGKFLGRRVPACGFSLGFDRLLELVTGTDMGGSKRIALLYDDTAPFSELFAEQERLIRSGYAVRITQSARNMRRVFSELEAEGVQGYVRLDDPGRTIRPLSEDV